MLPPARFCTTKTLNRPDAKDPNRKCDTQYGHTFARYALRHLHKPLIASQGRRSSAAAGFRTLPRSALFESHRGA
jgi:hypothetical protein